MQDIADRVGLSRSAVSLALRNHPSIPEATRERVRQAAAELGYRRNPLVAALMMQLRQPRHRATATLALITKFPRMRMRVSRAPVIAGTSAMNSSMPKPCCSALR